MRWGCLLGWSKLSRRLFLAFAAPIGLSINSYFTPPAAVSALSQQRCKTAGSKNHFSIRDQLSGMPGYLLTQRLDDSMAKPSIDSRSKDHPEVSRLLNICPFCLQRHSWSADVDEPQTHRSRPPLQRPSRPSPPTSSPRMSSPCWQICPHHYHAG